MNLLQRISRTKAAQEATGFLFASYLKLVKHTTRPVIEPPDAYAHMDPLLPVILAMWHGQHFMVPLALRPQDRATSLVSRSPDGELNAIVLRHLGIEAVRGSGARGRNFLEKGGVVAFEGLLKALAEGKTVGLTADVPKIARVCGKGIVTLAQLSGRPIIPIAIVSRRRIDFKSWDRASLGLPFGRGAVVVGAPIHVAPEADHAAREAARRAVQDGLDRMHERAYALIGARDPGARTGVGSGPEPERTALIGHDNRCYGDQRGTPSLGEQPNPSRRKALPRMRDGER
jgi:lysophospholipid acyltransferase (LPLAT)-like uncharacterized protein